VSFESLSDIIDNTCPNCGEEADDTSQDLEDYYVLKCPHCGLKQEIETSYMTLEELNDYRVSQMMTMLEGLPMQKDESQLW
jgi:predicted RNA-binding Zn-ribbon protein involved in translation (DUF1610 family)